jgi:hypothetical protein
MVAGLKPSQIMGKDSHCYAENSVKFYAESAPTDRRTIQRSADLIAIVSSNLGSNEGGRFSVRQARVDLSLSLSLSEKEKTALSDQWRCSFRGRVRPAAASRNPSLRMPLLLNFGEFEKCSRCSVGYRPTIEAVCIPIDKIVALIIESLLL